MNLETALRTARLLHRQRKRRFPIEHRNQLVIVDGVRTPFCRWNSSLASLGADELGRIAVNALLTRTGLDPKLVDEVIFGCVCQPAEAANVARVIALRAGIPESVPASTVHRNCASGLEAITTAAERAAAGHGSSFHRGRRGEHVAGSAAGEAADREETRRARRRENSDEETGRAG